VAKGLVVKDINIGGKLKWWIINSKKHLL
jgi:hypothetical protein